MYWLVRALLISLLMALSPFLYATPCHQLEQLNWLLGDWQAQKDDKHYWENCSASEAVFVNPAHDFPQRLHYQREQNKLVVRVESMQGEGFTLRFLRE